MEQVRYFPGGCAGVTISRPRGARGEKTGKGWLISVAKRPKKITMASIRESLTQQLVAKGADVDLYLDYIDKYMFYEQQERRMMADIRHRGNMVKAVSAQGKEYLRENPSIKHVTLFDSQKIKILDKLGLNTGNCRGADDGGGDL